MDRRVKPLVPVMRGKFGRQEQLEPTHLQSSCPQGDKTETGRGSRRARQILACVGRKRAFIPKKFYINCLYKIFQMIPAPATVPSCRICPPRGRAAVRGGPVPPAAPGAGRHPRGLGHQAQRDGRSPALSAGLRLGGAAPCSRHVPCTAEEGGRSY